MQISVSVWDIEELQQEELQGRGEVEGGGAAGGEGGEDVDKAPTVSSDRGDRTYSSSVSERSNIRDDR